MVENFQEKRRKTLAVWNAMQEENKKNLHKDSQFSHFHFIAFACSRRMIELAIDAQKAKNRKEEN